jgi:NADH-quinone oxidoreductase subunit K
MEITLNWYLTLSALLFSMGVIGFLFRRNAIIMLMCVELMLNSVNITLVAFSQYLGDVSGQVLVFFVMSVAAAEAAVGLALVIAIFRNKLTIDVTKINLFKY